MPGGQSGHPLSPYYQKGVDAWEDGKATPFLPGPPVHKLRLVPAVSGPTGAPGSPPVPPGRAGR